MGLFDLTQENDFYSKRVYGRIFVFVMKYNYLVARYGILSSEVNNIDLDTLSDSERELFLDYFFCVSNGYAPSMTTLTTEFAYEDAVRGDLSKQDRFGLFVFKTLLTKSLSFYGGTGCAVFKKSVEDCIELAAFMADSLSRDKCQTYKGQIFDFIDKGCDSDEK